MTIEKISRYYGWLSVVTFIVSIVGFMIVTEGTVRERIWIGILINLQFHLAFQSLSRLPLAMYQFIERGNPGIKELAKMFLRLFSWTAMILAIIAFIQFLVAAFSDYTKLLVTMTFLAIFFGGYSSKLKLD
jgi:hypothetical protein